MKKIFFILLSAIVLFACKQEGSTGNTSIESNTELEYFGETITLDDAIPTSEFFQHFAEGDSVELKVTGQINKVCKKKGCWMTMKLDGDQDLLVQFKDYGFFVPLNADGRTATIEGWAFKEERPVDELKHLAFDEGKTQEEIDAITEPEITYSFIANGVIIE